MRPPIPEVIKEIVDKDDSEAFHKVMESGFSRFFVPCLLEYLNRLLLENPDSIHDLCEYRVPLQSKDESLPLKVMALDGKEGLWFGFIGVINGMLEDMMGGSIQIAGTYDEGKLVRFTSFVKTAIDQKRADSAFAGFVDQL